MNERTARRLEAWFDGEVSPDECASIEALLKETPEARAYIDRLTRTREALQGAHLRENVGGATWRGLEERLDNLEERHAPKVVRFPQMAMAVAAVMILGMLLWLPLRQAGVAEQEEPFGLESTVLMVETDLENATPIVYIDQPSGWTVVWIMEAEESPGQGQG
ncbi:MAG TPA: hypothetical protein VK995_06155 [Oceanipulchritudo sp.]|nr:hypothetical protein [Oceanipulchritudo sp.]